MRRSTLIFLAACSALLLVVPAAQARTRLIVSPASPIVDDTVRISFRVAKQLPPGYHYGAILVVVRSSARGCAKIASKDMPVGRRPRAGRVVSFRFSSYDAIVDDGPEWCQGKVNVNVFSEKDGEAAGAPIRPIGRTSFRFRAKP